MLAQVFFIAWCTVTAAPALPSEQDVLQSAATHYPQITQALEQVALADAHKLGAEGAWDARVVSNNHLVPVGYYTRRYWDVFAEKGIGMGGARVYAGYSHGYPGMFPPQFNTLSTNIGGTPRVGGTINALRGLLIDDKRAALQRASLNIQKSGADAAATRIYVTREAAVTYWSWISALRNFQVYQELVAVAEERAAVLKQRMNAGDISGVVATENLQYLARRRAELASAELQLAQAALDLSLFYRDDTGAPRVLNARTHVGLEDGMLARIATIKVGDTQQGNAHAVSEQLIHRPDIVSLSKDLLANRVTIDQRENLMLPKIELGFDYTKNFGNQDPTNAPHVLTLFINLEVPIEYNFIRGNIAAAEAEQRMLNAQYDLMLQTASVEIQKSRERIRFAQERMGNARQETMYAEELLVAENYKFSKGGSNLFLVNFREEARAQAKENYIYAQLDVIRAHADYTAATAQYEP